jgi:hypothetical protein
VRPIPNVKSYIVNRVNQGTSLSHNPWGFT